MAETTYNRLSKEQLADVLTATYNETVTDTHECKKIYFAGPWFTDKDFDYYNFFYYDVFEDNPYYSVYFPRDFSKDNVPSPQDTFISNCREIDNCDMLIAIVDTKDVGTGWEIGYAYRQNKTIILVGLDETTFTESKTNLMLAACADEILTVKNLLLKLNGKEYFTIKMNSWEVIE